MRLHPCGWFAAPPKVPSFQKLRTTLFRISFWPLCLRPNSNAGCLCWQPIDLALGQVLYESGAAMTYVYFPTNAIVSLEDRGKDLLLTIADDGRGLPAELTGERKTYGLLGMRERVNMLGGAIVIDSEPGRGTHIEVTIPRSREPIT